VPGLYLAKYVVVRAGAFIVAAAVEEFALGFIVATKLPPHEPLKNSTVPFILMLFGKIAVRVIVPGIVVGQIVGVLALKLVGASFHLFLNNIVPDVTALQFPLITLYLILSAFPSLLLVFLGKQQTPEEFAVIQLLFQTPLLLPQSQTTVPVCPLTLIGVVKFPPELQKSTGPALLTLPRVGFGFTNMGMSTVDALLACPTQPKDEFLATYHCPGVFITAAGSATVELAVGPLYICHPILLGPPR
jgi:hypothetical protein